jgi:prepilin-type N-terminal cleavage/methylation domain-containing protein
MDPVIPPVADGAGASERGFSLLETLIALSIVAYGLLGLAAVFAHGLTLMTSSQAEYVAKEKAAEAIESVFAARDSRVLRWAELRNAGGGSGTDNGIFLDGPRQIRDPGPDGLVNTRDDGPLQQMASPGPDGRLGTQDDEITRLDSFTREIRIRDLTPSLREVQVTVTYQVGRMTRTFVVTGLMSSYV